jgi:hypothetical protein
LDDLVGNIAAQKRRALSIFYGRDFPVDFAAE